MIFAHSFRVIVSCFIYMVVICMEAYIDGVFDRWGCFIALIKCFSVFFFVWLDMELEKMCSLC